MNYRKAKQRNADLLRDDIHGKQTRFRGLPDIVTFHHSDVCDLRCVMCFQTLAPGTRTVATDRTKAILDELLPTARKLRLTSSGEPLQPGFEGIIERARHYQCRLELMTNGTNFNLENFLLMEDILERVELSVDSHIREVLDEIRGPGVFDALMGNIAEVGAYVAKRRKNFITIFNMTLMSVNLPHLSDFIRFARETRVDYVNIVRLNPLTEAVRERYDPFLTHSHDEIEGYVQAARVEAQNRNVNLLLENIGFEDVRSFKVREDDPAPLKTYACTSLMQETVIHPDEAVYACSLPGDLKMGSLRTHSFAKIWNGKRYRAMRKRMFSQRLVDPCATCPFYSPYTDPSAPLPIPGSEVF